MLVRVARAVDDGARRADRAGGGVDLDVLADHDGIGDVVGGRRVDVAGRREEDAALRRAACRIHLHLVDRQRADRPRSRCRGRSSWRSGCRHRSAPGRDALVGAERADATVTPKRHARARDHRVVGIGGDRDGRVGAGGGKRRRALLVVDRPVDDDARGRIDHDVAATAADELDVDRVRRLDRVGQRERQVIVDRLVPVVLGVRAAARVGMGVEVRTGLPSGF